jgi:hypothetical protein
VSHVVVPNRRNGWVAFARAEDLFAKLETAYRAIYEASGRPPTHFLAGWMTLGQLYADSQSLQGPWEHPLDLPRLEAMRWRDLPVTLDPTRRHGIVAVPLYDYLLSLPSTDGAIRLPAGAVWEGP